MPEQAGCLRVLRAFLRVLCDEPALPTVGLTAGRLFLVGRREVGGVEGVVEEVAGAAVEGGAEAGEGAEADALDLAGTEQGELGLGEADLGGEVAGLEALLHDQLVEGDADRHQIISSSSAWTLPACSTTPPSRNRTPPIMPRVIPGTSKCR